MTPEQRRAFVASLVADDGSLSSHDLQAIADGGIMDPSRLYLPAGRLSEADARAREARIMRGEAQ
jgi:hypothetical protein